MTTERKIELWKMLDKLYKAYVKKWRKIEKKSGFDDFGGLCYAIHDLRWAIEEHINNEEMIYLSDIIDTNIDLAEKIYDGDGNELDKEKFWTSCYLYPPKDVNSRYKFIKKQIYLLKDEKEV